MVTAVEHGVDTGIHAPGTITLHLFTDMLISEPKIIVYVCEYDVVSMCVYVC